MKKISLILVIITFVIYGYYLSDIYYFKLLILENNIRTPKEAYDYVGKVTFKRDSTTKAIKGNTPRYLLEFKKILYCDESAIVMAVFDNLLGYETRLVDIIGMDDISHHTVLQVKEHNKWIVYDRLYDNSNVEPYQTVDYEVLRIRIRKYPTIYQSITWNNYFLQKTALLLRGIKQ